MDYEMITIGALSAEPLKSDSSLVPRALIGKIYRIQTITVTHNSSSIIGIDFCYEVYDADKPGQTMTMSSSSILSKQHKGTNTKDAKEDTIKLDEGEYINIIQSRHNGKFVDKLILTTTKSNQYKFGNDNLSMEKLDDTMTLTCLSMGAISNISCRENLERLELVTNTSVEDKIKVLNEISETLKKGHYEKRHVNTKKIEEISACYKFEKKETSFLNIATIRKELLEVLERDELFILKYFLKKYCKEVNLRSTNFTFFKYIRNIIKTINHPQVMLPLNFFEIIQQSKQDNKEPFLNKNSIYALFEKLINFACKLPTKGKNIFKFNRSYLEELRNIYIDYMIITSLTIKKNWNESDAVFKDKIYFYITPPVLFFSHFLGFYKLSANFEKAFSLQKNELVYKNILLRRINAQHILNYERQSMVYCYQQIFFNLECLPSFVANIRRYSSPASKDATSLRKRNDNFYLISPVIPSEYKPFEKAIISRDSIQEASLVRHTIASIFTDLLESYPPNYVINENGEIIRVPFYVEPSDSAFEIKDSGLRNILFYFQKETTKKNEINLKELYELFGDRSFERKFIEFLGWLSNSNFYTFFKTFEFEENNHKKRPIYLLSEDMLNILYQTGKKKHSFFFDNVNLKIEDAISTLCPISSLVKNQVRTLFPDVKTQIEKIKRVNLEFLMSENSYDLKKIFRSKIRAYNKQRNALALKSNDIELNECINNWLKAYNIQSLDIKSQISILEEIIDVFPVSSNEDLFRIWEGRINWRTIIEHSYNKPRMINLMITLKIQLKEYMYEYSVSKGNYNILHLLIENEQSAEKADLVQSYIDVGGLSGDDGFPANLTPLELALEKRKHFFVSKLLECRSGFRVHPKYILDYAKASRDIEHALNSIHILTKYHSDVEWKIIWEELKKPDLIIEDEDLVVFDTYENGRVFLDKSMSNQIRNSLSQSRIFNKTIIQGNNQYSEFSLLLEENPPTVGVEIALGDIVTAIAGNDSPIINKTFGYISQKPYFISQNIPGVPLKEVIENDNLKILKEIDWSDLSMRIVLNIIFCTSFQGVDNEILFKNPKKHGRQKLMPINNVKGFGSFFASLSTKSELENKTMIYLMKTVSFLFCTDSMRHNIPKPTRKHLISLDVFSTMRACFETLIEKNLALGRLFDSYNKKGENICKIGIERRIIVHFLFRFLRMQQALKEKEEITHIELLRKVDPIVASFYEPTNFSHLNVKERFEHILRQSQLPLEDLRLKDASNFLMMQRFIDKEMLDNYLNSSLNEIIGPNEMITCLDEIQAMTKPNNPEMLNLENTRSLDLFAIMINNLSFSNMNIKDQEHWVNYMLPSLESKMRISFISEPFYLNFENMKKLNPPSIQKIALLRQVRILSLRGCPLGNEVIPVLALSLPLLHSLDLSNNPVLTSIEGDFKILGKILTNMIKSSASVISFYSLKHLNLSGCENLESITLRSDLSTIFLENCSKLYYFFSCSITTSNVLSLANFKGTSAFPEKELNKLLAQNTVFLLDNKTCKGQYASILSEAPNYPTMLSTNYFYSTKHLERILLVINREDNWKLREFLALKEMNEGSLYPLSQEIKKSNIKIKELIFRSEKMSLSNPLFSLRNSATEVFIPIINSVIILDLSGFSIAVKLVVENLKSTKTLRVLKMDAMETLSQNLGKLFQSISGNTSIEELSLRENKINAETLVPILKYLESNVNTTLQILDLSRNYLDDKAAQLLSKSLILNKTVQVLHIDAFPQTYETINKTIPEIIEKKIRFYFEKAGLKAIIECLNANKYLKKVCLCHHAFDQALKNEIEKVFQQSENLQEVDIFTEKFNIQTSSEDFFRTIEENEKKQKESKDKRAESSKMVSPKANIIHSKTLGGNEQGSIKDMINSLMTKTNEVFNSANSVTQAKNDLEESLYYEAKLRQEIDLTESVVFDYKPPVKANPTNNLFFSKNFSLSIDNLGLESKPTLLLNTEEEYRYGPLLLQSKNSRFKNVVDDSWVLGLGIDGGGIRGIIPALMIRDLCKRTNKYIHQMFDIVGGTSIGGILALGSSCSRDGKTPLCSPEDCVEMFTVHGKDIFGKSKSKIDKLGLTVNKYDETGLESVISKYCGQTLLSESLTNLIVTSVNKDNNDMVIFDSVSAFKDPDSDFFIKHVARATSAAPTFFSAAEFYNVTGTRSYSLIDGGVGKNNPAYFVIERAMEKAENYGLGKNFCVLSFGTGEFMDQKSLSQNAGIMEVKKVLNKCIDTHNELDEALFKEKYGEVRYRRYQPRLDIKNIDTSLDNSDPVLLNHYTEAALKVTSQFEIENYGPCQDRSLIDFILENTDKKVEFY